MKAAKDKSPSVDAALNPKHPHSRKLQQRGERRRELLLNAAEELFAEVGYAKTTTNHIADRAGVSPGTLYQFFANKEEFGQALIMRYALQLSSLYERVFQVDVHLPLARMIDKVVDPLISFHVDAPAFITLFSVSGENEEWKQTLRKTVSQNMARLIQARNPSLAAARVASISEVSVMCFRGVVPSLNILDKKHRDMLIREFKLMMRSYLEPFLGE